MDSLGLQRSRRHVFTMVAPHDPVPRLKRQLGAAIARELAGWRASDLSELMRANPARISALRRGRLERFSLETLIRYCARLRLCVELVLKRDRFGGRGED